MNRSKTLSFKPTDCAVLWNVFNDKDNPFCAIVFPFKAMLLPLCAMSENLLNTPFRGAEVTSAPDDDDGDELSMIILYDASKVRNSYSTRVPSDSSHNDSRQQDRGHRKVRNRTLITEIASNSTVKVYYEISLCFLIADCIRI